MDKVSIIGGGNVGANTAFFIAEKGITDVCLHDIQEGLSTGKSLDMMEAAPIRKYRNRIRGIPDIGGIAGSESVIIAAGRACPVGGGRGAPVEENWETVKGIVEQVLRVSPESIIIVATEPVDSLVTLIARTFAVPRNRLLGLGGILDSTRLKSAISRDLSLSAENITAMVIGRHAEDMIVLTDYTRVSGIPVALLMPAEDIGRLMNEVRTADSLMAELSECPGSYYTPSAAAAEIVDAIHMDLKRIVPVSVEMKGEYGVSGAALSLPCVIGAGGVETVMTPALAAAELDALKRSAEAVMKNVAFHNGAGRGALKS